MSRGVLRRTTGTVRRTLPPPARRPVRRLALGWGWLTAPWRQLPSVVVVGAQRCGTTTLFRMMAEHPELMRPTLDKGTGYFDDHYLRGPRWYAAHFPLRLSLWWSGRGRRVRVFECSGYYLFHPLAAQRMAGDLPGVQVVVLVRDPVDRANSAHRHERARGFEDLDFEDAVAAESARLRGETERLAGQPGATSHAHRHHAYLARSHYRHQLERLVAAVGRERVHVVEAERLFTDPVGEFDRLQRSLGLTRHRTQVLTAWNTGPGAGLDPDLRARLQEQFVSDDRWLGTLLGHPPIWQEEV